MPDQFSRTRLLIGEDGLERLRRARVIIFGIGGVGGYAAEALARAGVGALSFVDDDKICLTNLNRQLHALRSTVGHYKVDVAAERIAQINPNCAVTVHKTFFLPSTEDEFDFAQYDYVLDAIDTVAGKIALILKAQAAGTPILSCMGAGNKLDASAFCAADIYETGVCPLARVMRRELRARGVKSLRVVYSAEKPLEPYDDETHSCRSNCICPPGAARNCDIRRQIPGSISFVPAAAGLVCAGEIVKGLLTL
ncbi:MAG: tRNA threonylcarbamoyladenosine dehydratase [Oscillospiraceae bacterium]|jgi:tRNA A37 threonylcarbamoyladenosine dehydratase|nr:tRNA threonylcarbamoyladenosine dehydratase [Oscillospiraceae bacterium]